MAFLSLASAVTRRNRNLVTASVSRGRFGYRTWWLGGRAGKGGGTHRGSRTGRLGGLPHDDPDALFVQGAAQNRAKAICSGCSVRTECLADALDNRVEFGVWGGMTERERRALLRRRPNVTSWRQLLQTARETYEQRDDRRGQRRGRLVAAS